MIISVKYKEIIIGITLLFIYSVLFEFIKDFFIYYFLGYFLLFALAYLIPFIIKSFKRISSYLSEQKRVIPKTVEEKSYIVLLDLKIKKEEKHKLIFITTALTILFYILIIFAHKYLGIGTKSLYFSSSQIVFISLILFNIGRIFYNRKEFLLSFDSDELLEFDNSIVNCKLRKESIEKIERVNNFTLNVFTKNTNILTISIPYTSLIKERDEEVRTELLDEVIDLINNA